MPAAVVAERSVRISQHHQPSHQAESFAVDNGEMLFKHVTPRRRQDQFGRDSTRHADYLLSMAVFPTGVRTPLLSELQRKTEHQCGFEVVDKGLERAGRHVYIRGSKPNSSRRDSATDSVKKPPPNTPLTVSTKLSDRITTVSQSISMSPSPRKAPSIQKYRWVKSSGPGRRESCTEGSDLKQKDIRDPLYLNTYCPEERKLRYKKTSLPRISNRTRPWTVSEPNPSYRFARNSQNVTSGKLERSDVKPAWRQGQRPGNFRIDARDVIARPKGRAAEQAPNDMQQDGEEVEDTDSVSGSQALLEVKSYFPHSEEVTGDQRDSLRGKEGCLHSRVKQCIRFVKTKEKLARSVERPLKQEGGKYRPFSTTTVRTPRITPASSPRLRHPDPASVEIYKEYIDTIALQTRLVSAADRRRKPRQAVSGVPRYNTAASNYHDGSSAFQSTADSSRPSPISATNVVAEKTTRLSETPRSTAQNSSAVPSASASVSVANAAAAAAASAAAADRDQPEGLYGGPDPRGVHQALDIIRLSPKAQPPRSSRTSRAGGGNRSFREGAEGGEGGAKTGEGKAGQEDGEEGKAKTHAIILPNVCKSATTSVCSFADEPANAAET